jgi:Raf kinase inhibitor-like YbhB/YbcL family protein
MQLTSAAFQPEGTIPARFTADGEDVSPEFSWRDAPPEAKSFAFTMHDPDAPRVGGFAHWIVFNIPENIADLEENVPRKAAVSGLGMQGKNDAGTIGYMGPAPPSGTHRYFARIFALDTKLNLQPGCSYRELESAMEGHILERAELMGVYSRRSGRAA